MTYAYSCVLQNWQFRSSCCQIGSNPIAESGVLTEGKRGGSASLTGAPHCHSRLNKLAPTEKTRQVAGITHDPLSSTEAKRRTDKNTADQ